MVRPRLASAVVLSALLVAQSALAGINLVGSEPTTVSPKPEFMATGDLNGDGRQDILVVSPNSKELNTYLAADTPSHFAPARVTRFGGALRGPAVGDLDEDGKLDVVVADQAAEGVWMLRGKGDGSFLQPSLVRVAGSRNPYAVAIANWDKTGRPDLAVADRRLGKVFILLNRNQPQPQFRPGGEISTGEEPSDVRAIDLNDDGNLDLLTLNLGGPRVKDVAVVLWKRVAGTNPDSNYPEFEVPVKFTVGENPTDLIIADFNNDGNDDIAMLNRAAGVGNSEIDVLMSQGNGILLPPVSFPVACPFYTGGSPCRAHAMAAADFDVNGTIDLMVAMADPRRSRGSASSLADAMQAFGGGGDGDFVSGPVFPILKAPVSMAVGDLTGDGKPEVVVANQRTLSLQAFVNISSSGDIENGGECLTGEECLSSRCTNGVCCASACEPNEQCNVPGREGICIPRSDGGEVCEEQPDCENDNNFCVDGFCCDTDCVGGRCNVPDFEGICIPGIPDGEPCSGDDAECSSRFCSDNFRCCREACDGGFCDQFGVCHLLRDNGDICNEDAECSSEVCDAFDGICCNRRCNEMTEECKSDGRCAPIGSAETPLVTTTPIDGTPTPTPTHRLTPGGNGEDCSVSGDCSSTFCVNNVCCVEETCGGDAHCQAGTGECASGGTPTRTPTSTRLPSTPTVNPCGSCPKGTRCQVVNGAPICISSSSGGGCSTSGGGDGRDIAIAFMLPLALWVGRRWQLQRAHARRR
jgi:hypothetical protein